MRGWIEFLATYPLWVKVTVSLLFSAIILLLVVFRPTSKSEVSASALPVTPPTVGQKVVLDISQGQGEWRGLTAWAEDAGFPVELVKGPFSRDAFGSAAPGVLVMSLPYEELLSEGRVAAVKGWVERGGGLFVLGYYAADTHHGSDPSRLTREWGISFEDNLLAPPNVAQENIRRHVFRADESLGIRITIPGAGHPIVDSVGSIVVLSSASLDIEHASVPIGFALASPTDTKVWQPDGPLDRDGMRPLIERWLPAGEGSRTFFVAFSHGRGKVAICGTWKLAALDYADNRKFISNVIEWLRPSRSD